MTTTLEAALDKSAERALRQEWRTPADFYAVIHAEFAPDIDVCATHANTKCMQFIGPPGYSPYEYSPRDVHMVAEDGLTTPWQNHGTVAWCNAGFGNILPWMFKCADEAERGMTVLLVTHVGVTTPWWALGMHEAAECRLLVPMVDYVAPPGVKQTNNPRDGALWVFRPRRPAFGAHVVRWSWDQGGGDGRKTSGSEQ